MQGRFYADPFLQAGIALAAPAAEDREYIHDRYMGIPFLDTTRLHVQEAVKRLLS